MKKKVLAVALAVALIAIVVSSSLAYFTAEDEVTNTFTIGSVKIDIVEDFETPTAMIPVVTVSETDPNYINKDARVKNTGENPAYVQMYVAIPKALDDAKAFIVVDTNSSDWTVRTFVEAATIGNVTYNVYKYQYTKELAVNTETGDVITAAYLAPAVDYQNGKFVMNGTVIENYTPGESVEIYVAAQAIQSQGFADYSAALDNFTAHPWATN